MIRRNSARQDLGMTLPELLVSIIVFGILAGAVVATMTSTLGFFRSTSARASDLNGVQVAVDAMAKALQTATVPPVVSGVAPDAIISAGPSDLSFYAYDTTGKGPSKIRFFINSSNQLVEQRTAATNCTPPFTYGATTSRVLASGVTSGDPSLFTYDAAPTPSQVSGSPLPFVGSPKLLRSDPDPVLAQQHNDDDIGKVEMVNISLSVYGTPGAKVQASTASTTVDLVNHLVQSRQGVTLLGNSC
ncbi:MAG TPA: type II secretion system protein [Mycobacteriales bacterium]|nr:type II secretion system protein [Mycobacteriales bacterium]